MEIANTKTIVPLWETPMFRNYLEIALRSFARHKLHSFINIVGLALGIGGV
jgi:hypothetical protein